MDSNNRAHGPSGNGNSRTIQLMDARKSWQRRTEEDGRDTSGEVHLRTFPINQSTAGPSAIGGANGGRFKENAVRAGAGYEPGNQNSGDDEIYDQRESRQPLDRPNCSKESQKKRMKVSNTINGDDVMSLNGGEQMDIDANGNVNAEGGSHRRGLQLRKNAKRRIHRLYNVIEKRPSKKQRKSALSAAVEQNLQQWLEDGEKILGSRKDGHLPFKKRRYVRNSDLWMSGSGISDGSRIAAPNPTLGDAANDEFKPEIVSNSSESSGRTVSESNTTDREPPLAAEDLTGTQRRKSSPRNPWTPAEDTCLRELVKLHGLGNWQIMAKCMKTRNSKQIRTRWCSKLDPDLNHDPFSREEDMKILQGMQDGSSYKEMRKNLNKRSDIAVRNRYDVLSNKVKQIGEDITSISEEGIDSILTQIHG